MKKATKFRFIGTAAVFWLVMAVAAGCTAQAQQSTDPTADDNRGASENLKIQATEDSRVTGAEVRLEGTVESVNGNIVVIDGVSVTLPPDVASQIQVGDTIKIEGTVGEDGALINVEFEFEDDDDLTETPEASETPEMSETPDDETPEPAETEDISGDDSSDDSDSSDDDDSSDDGDSSGDSSDDGGSGNGGGDD